MDAEVASFMGTVYWILGWYGIGLVFTTILCIMAIMDGKTEEVRLKDFEEYFMWALGGPLIGLIVLSILFLKATSGIRSSYSGFRHKVLWRSKTSRTKQVLYGDQSNDDD